MPKKYERREKVAEAIKRELAHIIQTGGIKDDRLSAFISIIDVEMNHKLSSAKVTYSILDPGEDELSTQIGTQAALEANTGHIRGMVCRKLNLRYAPELIFKHSDSLKNSVELVNLIDKLVEEDEGQKDKE